MPPASASPVTGSVSTRLRRMRPGGIDGDTTSAGGWVTQELRGRPYDLVQVAGGYALRTKTRFAPGIRAAHPGRTGDEDADLTRTETIALRGIPYLQPVTRGEISRLAGREISRDIIASLKRHGLIDGAIRAPQAGAPFAY